jgi:hypothetical protein
MQVNNEGSNLFKMQQHALKRSSQLKDTLTHEKIDLLSLLDSSSSILNATSGSSLTKGWIESDSDAQLIIRLIFKKRVNVDSVVLFSASPSGPKEVRFFTNLPTLDFSEVDDLLPHKTEIPQEGKVTLGGTKFSRISSLELFVVGNFSESPTTRIEQLSVLGTVADHF